MSIKFPKFQQSFLLEYSIINSPRKVHNWKRQIYEMFRNTEIWDLLLQHATTLGSTQDIPRNWFICNATPPPTLHFNKNSRTGWICLEDSYLKFAIVRPVLIFGRFAVSNRLNEYRSIMKKLVNKVIEREPAGFNHKVQPLSLTYLIFIVSDFQRFTSQSITNIFCYCIDAHVLDVCVALFQVKAGWENFHFGQVPASLILMIEWLFYWHEYFLPPVVIIHFFGERKWVLQLQFFGMIRWVKRNGKWLTPRDISCIRRFNFRHIFCF